MSQSDLIWFALRSRRNSIHKFRVLGRFVPIWETSNRESPSQLNGLIKCSNTSPNVQVVMALCSKTEHSADLADLMLSRIKYARQNNLEDLERSEFSRSLKYLNKSQNTKAWICSSAFLTLIRLVIESSCYNGGAAHMSLYCPRNFKKSTVTKRSQFNASGRQYLVGVDSQVHYQYATQIEGQTDWYSMTNNLPT